MLGRHTHTHTAHTNTIGPTVFNDPLKEIFDHNAFNATALKPLFATILH